MEMPSVIPVTMPLADPTETFVLLALHDPPLVALVRVMLCAWQTAEAPKILDGSPFTVTGVKVLQPPGNE
jgi:hypothetical protein